MKKILLILLNASCVAGGYAIGHYTTKKKYRKLCDAEVESVKKVLSEYYESKGVTKPAVAAKEQKTNKPAKDNKLIDKDSIDYEALKKERDYSKYLNNVSQYKEERYVVKKEAPVNKVTDSAVEDGPYVISPGEFGDGEYVVKNLFFYSDGVLCDEDFNIIKNIKDTIGSEALNSFGDDDAVYVRDIKNEVDYEILKQDEKYSDVAPRASVGQFPGDDEIDD